MTRTLIEKRTAGWILMMKDVNGRKKKLGRETTTKTMSKSPTSMAWTLESLEISVSNEGGPVAPASAPGVT